MLANINDIYKSIYGGRYTGGASNYGARSHCTIQTAKRTALWGYIFYGEYDGKRSERVLIKIIGEYMKYKISDSLIMQEEIARLDGDGYRAFLIFAFAYSDMISLTAEQVSMENGHKLVAKYAPALVSEIIDTEETNQTHCTTLRGRTVPVFYFRIGKATKEFLQNKRSFWDFNCYCDDWLDDLAFYRDGVCWLSTCTHEDLFWIDAEKANEYLRIAEREKKR
jgi:hypothetical protein